MKLFIIHIFSLIFPLSNNAYGTADPLINSLYRKKFTLDHQNIPKVSIGIFHNIREVEIATTGNIQIGTSMMEGISVNTSSVLQFKLKTGKKAEIDYYIALTDIPYDSWKKFSSYYQKSIILEQGYLIALNGKMLDNRRILPSIGPFKTYDKAKIRLKNISKKYKKAFIHSKLKNLPEGNFSILPLNGSFSVSGADAVKLKSSKGNPFIIKSGNTSIKVAGEIYVVIDSSGMLAVVNELPLEKYLEGILPSELWPGAPYEALKAQAVAARGQVLSKMGTRHMTDPFHLCRKVHCQVYDGINRLHKKTTAACHATKGQILFTPSSRVVDTVYHSSCGGHTEHNENVWGGIPQNTLRGTPDLIKGHISSNISNRLLKNEEGWCKKSNPGFRWTSKVSIKRISDNLKKRGFYGKIKSIRIINRGISGRVLSLEARSKKSSIIIKGELTIRKLLGNLKSSMFIHKFTDDKIIFNGGGYGHGVGMCQWGAINRAKAGQNYKKILLHYYKGSILKKLY
ncbi:MAG: SpoIID/LytB domain-containing protein [Deltaproteobacteria bacterium]|nr:SpoIID/LytB domain-containing protein [Deltaproteobacteria bacterium]